MNRKENKFSPCLQLEPLSDLFYPPQTATKSTSFQSTPVPALARRPPKVPTKASSQLGSDALISTTNITETATTKSYKKPPDSKMFDEQHIEEVIAKAPAAAHSMLKVEFFIEIIVHHGFFVEI